MRSWHFGPAGPGVRLAAADAARSTTDEQLGGTNDGMGCDVLRAANQKLWTYYAVKGHETA